MFEYLKMNKINKTGVEHVSATVNLFKLDEDGLGHGTTIVLTNNHAKNTYQIDENRLMRGSSSFVRIIERGKDETMGVEEFKKWLINNGYSDREFINVMKGTYRDAYEKYYS